MKILGKKENYIDKMIEWQEHQYLPGYFIGDKMPLNILSPEKPRRFGSLYIISVIIYLCFLFFSIGLTLADRKYRILIIISAFIGALYIFRYRKVSLTYLKRVKR